MVPVGAVSLTRLVNIIRLPFPSFGRHLLKSSQILKCQASSRIIRCGGIQFPGCLDLAKGNKLVSHIIVIKWTCLLRDHHQVGEWINIQQGLSFNFSERFIHCLCEDEEVEKKKCKLQVKGPFAIRVLLFLCLSAYK